MNELAEILVNLLRVVTDAADAQPGKAVHVDVLPGFSPSLPTAGTLTGPLAGVLNTLVLPVKLTVQYDVKKDGVSVASTDFSSTPPITLNTDTDLLNVAFLLRPPFGEDTVATQPFHYEIDVTLKLSLEGNPPVSHTISVPIDMPAIQIPSLLLLGKYANFTPYGGDGAGSLFVMVRASSPARDLGTVVATLNRVLGVVKTLQSFLDFGSDFVPALEDAARLIGTMPTVYFSVGNCHDFDADGFDFENDASSLLLVGVLDDTKTAPQDNQTNVPTVPGFTQVTLYSKTDFALDGIDAEHRTFSLAKIEEIVIAQPGIPDIHTGVGFKRIDDFSNPPLSWATEQGDHMDDTTLSVRWGGVDT